MNVRFPVLAMLLTLSTVEGAVTDDDKQYSPNIDQTYPQKVFWGDTHLHTVYSTDAGFAFNRLGPEDAYRFAKGYEVESSTGVRAKIDRPLDFLVIADHAENLGLPPAIFESDPELLANDWGKKLHDMVRSGIYEKVAAAYKEWMLKVYQRDDPLVGTKVTESYWHRLLDAADKHNDPRKFTALIGFEWTSMPGGNNLHRNVIFRDGKDRAGQIIPFSAYDSENPQDLWAWMDNYEQKTGGKLLALAHNGNLSNGLMFDDMAFSSKQTDSKQRIDRKYAELRARWEPLYEVTQIKGDGEAHPFLSPDDEFADFGIWDKGSFGQQSKEPDMLRREYAREAFKRGMKFEQELGVNPFKFGLVGSTDSHTALATAEENNFLGKVSAVEPGQTSRRFDEAITGRTGDGVDPDLAIYHKEALASGYAAVWARENTREDLWDAMKRREVYATTGTRITLRVFAGRDLKQGDELRPDFVKYGYSHGVPMGGELGAVQKGKSPGFVVHALKDPRGANLDRVQVIKGWVDKDGELQERVYDIAVSDGRKIGKDGRCRTPVGNTVNVKEASYTNAIGATAFTTFWQDPEFVPQESAFYYVRVIEIPTPRWTTYDAKAFNLALPSGVDTVTQERAYSSPIWYTPKGQR